MKEKNLNSIDYATILDESTSPVQDTLRTIASFSGEMKDEDSDLTMNIEEVTMTVPVELDVHLTDEGKVVLGSSTRHTTADVSFEPTLHQLKITIAEEKSLL